MRKPPSAQLLAAFMLSLALGIQAQEKPLAPTEKAYQVGDASPVGNVSMVHS